MEMHQIKYFLAAASTLRFARAAEMCNVSAPALNRGIKLLEAEFGGELFRREGNRTHLTELGRIVLPHLQQIADAAQRAKSESVKALQFESSKLAIGIMCTIVPNYFIEVISGFHHKWPKISLNILDDTAQALQSKLLAGDLDVAIYASPGLAENDNLNTIELYTEDMTIVLSKANDLARGTKLYSRDLNGLPYIERVNCEFATYGEKLFVDRGIEGPTICQSERDDWVLGLVAQNLGYSFLPVSAAKFEGVVTRRIEDLPIKRTVNLVTVRGRKHSPAVGAFVHEVARVGRPQGGKKPTVK